MQRSRLVVRAGTVGVVACGLVLAVAATRGGQAPPPALGPAIVVQVAGPSRPASPAPALDETCRPTPAAPELTAADRRAGR
jgi:hypothetical protein